MTHQRILANVNRDEFVGRDAELRQLVDYSSRREDTRGLLLLGAPNVGVSELLRQAYDELFDRRGEAIPIYFAFRRSDGAATDEARAFFHNFIQQYIAYRRVDASLCAAPLTFHDFGELALPTDYELISELIEGFERERGSSDQRALINFSLTAPQRVGAKAKRRIFPLIDCVRLIGISHVRNHPRRWRVCGDACLGWFTAPETITSLLKRYIWKGSVMMTHSDWR